MTLTLKSCQAAAGMSGGMSVKAALPRYRRSWGCCARCVRRPSCPQRDLGKLLGKPQSWVHNCEVGNRRVDVAELAAWAIACGVEPATAFSRFLHSVDPRAGTGTERRVDG